MLYMGSMCDMTGLCKKKIKILLSNFVTSSQYIDSLPSQVDPSCFDSLSCWLFAGENPKSQKTGISDSKDTFSTAKVALPLFRCQKMALKGFGPQ